MTSVDIGAGEAVYLLPGLLCDQTVWAEQIRCLKDSHRVVVADFRGQSSLTEMAAMVIDHAPDQFNLVGHSMGARVALEIMRLAPERVLRLGLLDTGTHPPRPDEPNQRQVLVDIAYAEGMPALAERWLPPMVHEGRLDDAALMDPLRQMILSMTPDIYKGQIAALLSRPDASSGLSDISCPTLVGVGRQDRWSPPEQHEAIVKLIRSAYLVLFENSGHMAPVEAPQAVNEALVNWLKMPLQPMAQTQQENRV